VSPSPCKEPRMSADAAASAGPATIVHVVSLAAVWARWQIAHESVFGSITTWGASDAAAGVAPTAAHASTTAAITSGKRRYAHGASSLKPHLRRAAGTTNGVPRHAETPGAFTCRTLRRLDYSGSGALSHVRGGISYARTTGSDQVPSSSRCPTLQPSRR